MCVLSSVAPICAHSSNSHISCWCVSTVNSIVPYVVADGRYSWLHSLLGCSNSRRTEPWGEKPWLLRPPASSFLQMSWWNVTAAWRKCSPWSIDTVICSFQSPSLFLNGLRIVYLLLTCRSCMVSIPLSLIHSFAAEAFWVDSSPYQSSSTGSTCKSLMT